MARTQAKPSNNGLENWFSAHQEAKRREQVTARTPEIQGFMDFLWPVAVEYYSPLNPVLLSECLSPDQMNQRPVHFVRDGLVPLLWFFKVNPTPAGFKGKLLICMDSLPFVPEAWRGNVGAYRLESTRPAGKGKKLLLTGIVMDTFCSTTHLDLQLDRLIERVGKQELAKKEIQAFLLGKYDGFGNEHLHEFVPDFMIRICAKLGTRIQPLNWRRIEATGNFDDYDVVEFNEGLLFADSFMLHFLMGRGARMIEFGKPVRIAPDSSEFVHLSPYHGVRVWTSIPNAAFNDPARSIEKGLKALSRFEAAMQSETNKRFPWPAWFTQWSRHTARESC